MIGNAVISQICIYMEIMNKLTKKYMIVKFYKNNAVNCVCLL